MNTDSAMLGRVLAEVLRLQRWAFGESVPADRVHGLLHGFESATGRELDGFGIPEDVQKKVEDMLADVDAKRQPTDGPAVRARFRRDGVTETAAHLVMELCLMAGRFTDAVQAVADGPGASFTTLARRDSSELRWRGALHYVELVDNTEGARRPLQAVWTAAIPRVGETVTPERGSPMIVVGVDYIAESIGAADGPPKNILTPYVVLEPLPDDDE